jgi:hypothetical protein
MIGRTLTYSVTHISLFTFSHAIETLTYDLNMGALARFTAIYLMYLEGKN